LTYLSHTLYDVTMKTKTKKSDKKPSKKPAKHQAVRVSVNQNAAEPMHVMGQTTKLPEVGDVLRVLPDRFLKSIFAKTVKVERISVEGGVTVFHATTC
jgi:hypothetical protein